MGSWLLVSLAMKKKFRSSVRIDFIIPTVYGEYTYSIRFTYTLGTA